LNSNDSENSFKQCGSQRFQRISLYCATWNNLPQDDKSKWDTLSPAGKAQDAIISGTRSRGVELSHAKIPVKPSPDVMKTLIKNTCSVAFANGTDAMPPEDSIMSNSADSHDRQIVNANFLASKPRENEDTLLINLAK
jgi:hypothetical protein